MTQTTYINVELSQPNVPVVVYAKQSDSDTRIIKATMYNNGTAYVPPDTAAGVVSIGKPDGGSAYYDVDDVTGNKVTFRLIGDALTAAGTATADVAFLDRDGNRLTSFSFNIIIEERAVSDRNIVSSDYYRALLDASGSYIKNTTLLKVKGYYATLSALSAAVPNPSAGDIYAVGASAPYSIYIYDPVSETWINNGTFGQSGTVYLGQTAGTENALTVTSYSGSIPHGYTFTIMPHVNVLTGATLKIGNGSALPILSHEGTPIPNNMVFKDVPITLIYRQVPTPAYIATFDTQTVSVGNSPTVDGTKLVWPGSGDNLRGYYVSSVTLKSGGTSAGQTAVYSMKLNDDDETEVGTFSVYNGTDGFEGITAERAVITDSNGGGTASVTTATELSYVHGVTSAIQTQIDNISPAANAGAHNSIFRGKSLGTSITTEQYDAIHNGTFDDLYIGDYWTLPITYDGNIHNAKVRVADFGYFDGTLDTSHAVCVIDDLYSITGAVPMDSSNSTAYNAYQTSTMRSEVLSALTTALSDVVEILPHRDVGFPGIEQAYVEIMTCMMALGVHSYPLSRDNWSSNYNMKFSKTDNNHFRQLSLYRLVSISSLLPKHSGHLMLWLRDPDIVNESDGQYITIGAHTMSSSRPTESNIPLVYFCI